MERNAIILSYEKNPGINLKVLPGHFTTSNSHISHYIDVSSLKSDVAMAREAAREMALPYLSRIAVDTIVCTEKTEVIGAFLAEELMGGQGVTASEGAGLHVVTPLYNNLGHLSFQSSMVPHIINKSVILLSAMVSSGRALDSAIDCISYYRGKVTGISSIFQAFPERSGLGLHALFTSDDIDGYRLYGPRDCEMCRSGQRLDALISSEGYTKI